MSRYVETLTAAANYVSRHTVCVGTELELYVEEQAGHYWLGARHTQEPETAVMNYGSLSLHQLRRAADTLTAVVERLEREAAQ